MPLTPELEALLGTITDQAKREGLRKELESGYLRQSDYSRKMNEIAETEKTRAEAYAKGINWVETNKANYAEAIRQRDAAIAKAKEAEEKAAQLSSSTTHQTDFNVDMSDEAAVAEAIRKANAEAQQARQEAAKLAATVTRINKMIDDGELVTATKFEEEAGKRLEAFSRATMDVLGTIAKGKSEFGIDIDRDKLLNEAAKYGGDLNKAYESVTADARLEKLKADIRNEVGKEYEAKYANTNGNPLAPGVPPLVGPLQAMIDGQRNPEGTIDSSIKADGSGRLARAIAAELRAEGKF